MRDFPTETKGDAVRPEAPGPPAAPAHVGSHALLFEEAATESTRCDVCGEPVTNDDDGYAVGGSGLYVWTRGSEVRYEEPPLCGHCGTAIGVMALAQWDLEEDEG